MRRMGEMVGVEYLVDALGCDPAALRDRGVLTEICETILADLQLKRASPPHWHEFAGAGGVTGAPSVVAVPGGLSAEACTPPRVSGVGVTGLGSTPGGAEASCASVTAGGAAVEGVTKAEASEPTGGGPLQAAAASRTAGAIVARSLMPVSEGPADNETCSRPAIHAASSGASTRPESRGTARAARRWTSTDGATNMIAMPTPHVADARARRRWPRARARGCVRVLRVIALVAASTAVGRAR